MKNITDGVYCFSNITIAFIFISTFRIFFVVCLHFSEPDYLFSSCLLPFGIATRRVIERVETWDYSPLHLDDYCLILIAV